MQSAGRFENNEGRCDRKDLPKARSPVEILHNKPPPALEVTGAHPLSASANEAKPMAAAAIPTPPKRHPTSLNPSRFAGATFTQAGASSAAAAVAAVAAANRFGGLAPIGFAARAPMKPMNAMKPLNPLTPFNPLTAVGGVGGLPSFRMSLPVRARSTLFGGGAEDSKAIGRRIRWVSKRDPANNNSGASSGAFLTVQRQVLAHFWEMCRKSNTNPSLVKAQIENAEAIVVSEDMVPLIDPSTGQIVPAKPLMPPNTTLHVTGFIVLRIEQKFPRLLFADVICTTPGRSQGKALLSFVIQKARELGFLAIRLGNTDETIPIRLPLRHPSPPPFFNPASKSTETATTTTTTAAVTDAESDADQDTMTDNDNSDTDEEDDPGAHSATDDDNSDGDDDDIAKTTTSAVASSGGALPAGRAVRRRLGRVPVTRVRVGGVDDLYRGFMRYLETQKLFQPRLGGHLLQFVN